jgi:hypothetical protein
MLNNKLKQNGDSSLKSFALAEASLTGREVACLPIRLAGRLGKALNIRTLSEIAPLLQQH